MIENTVEIRSANKFAVIHYNLPRPLSSAQWSMAW